MSFVSRWRHTIHTHLKIGIFQPNTLAPFHEKNFSVFPFFADNLLLYLGRWDVDVAIGKGNRGEEEREKKKVNLTKEP